VIVKCTPCLQLLRCHTCVHSCPCRAPAVGEPAAVGAGPGGQRVLPPDVAAAVPAGAIVGALATALLATRLPETAAAAASAVPVALIQDTLRRWWAAAGAAVAPGAREAVVAGLRPEQQAALQAALMP
jgi:hypothetical protein